MRFRESDADETLVIVDSFKRGNTYIEVLEKGKLEAPIMVLNRDQARQLYLFLKTFYEVDNV